MSYELMILASILGILISFLPAFIIFLYLARRTESMWISGIVGGTFWLIAFLARLPILIPLNILPLFFQGTPIFLFFIVILFSSSLLAGIFEEGIKYFVVKSRPKFIETRRHVLCLGLGWGLGEAVLLYMVNIIALIPFLPLFVPDPGLWDVFAIQVLAGAVERNSAILFHVASSLVVALAVWRGKRLWVWLAIFLHFILNFVSIMILQFYLVPIFGSNTLSIGIFEGIVALIAILMALLAYYL